MSPENLITLAVAGLALAGQIYSKWQERGLNEANAGKAANDAAVGMINQLQEENAVLRQRQLELETKLTSQTAEYDARLQAMEDKLATILKEKAAAEQERARLESENLDLRRTVWAYQEGYVND